MVPERVQVMSELPRTSTGKVDRQKLIALSVTNGTWVGR
jgi:acyl-coenzyme A synthetase/AMP-(fatty) acid ligase